MVAPMLDPKAFKAYDVRGLYRTELDEAGAYAIGRAYVEQFEPARIAVGRDMRLSAPDDGAGGDRGAADGGADVLDLGMVGTEMLYFAVGELGLDGGIAVTASHNPKQYTGMKIVRRGALPVGGESGLLDVRDRAIAGAWRDAARGEMREEDIWDAFRRTRALVRRRRRAAPAAGRDRRCERDGGRDAAAGARPSADARRRALLLRAGRLVPESRAESAAAREPRVHHRARRRASAPTSASHSTATRIGASSSTTPASSSRATSRPHSSPRRSSRRSRAAR